MNTLESDVLLARDGDEAAFRRLVETSANTVCSIALAIVRNVQASEDVAQEVFLNAWANLRQLRNPASFLPWLRQVTRNQAHLWLRKHAREIGDEEILAAAGDARPSQTEAVLIVVTLGCAAIALSLRSAMTLLVATQAVYFAIGYLYLFRLPRILQWRMEWEKSINPEVAKQNRRQWMWATTGRALGAAIAGAVLMAMAIAIR